MSYQLLIFIIVAPIVFISFISLVIFMICSQKREMKRYRANNQLNQNLVDQDQGAYYSPVYQPQSNNYNPVYQLQPVGLGYPSTQPNQPQKIFIISLHLLFILLKIIILKVSLNIHFFFVFFYKYFFSNNFSKLMIITFYKNYQKFIVCCIDFYKKIYEFQINYHKIKSHTNP